MCTSFFDEKAWICARPTAHHDLASVIPDKKKEKEKKKKCKSETVVIFCRPEFCELIKSARLFCVFNFQEVFVN